MVYVDTVCHGLLQCKEVNRLPLQYVCGGFEELVKPPTPLLISLKYTCKHRNQLHPQTPAETERDRGDSGKMNSMLSYQIITVCNHVHTIFMK